MASELLITDANGIRLIAEQLSPWRVDRRKLAVRLPSLDEEANENLLARLQVHYGACGCGQGRLAGLLALAAFALLVVTGVVSIHDWGIGKLIVLYFMLSFAVMSVVKVFSMNGARKKLRLLADELERRESKQVRNAHGADL